MIEIDWKVVNFITHSLLWVHSLNNLVRCIIFSRERIEAKDELFKDRPSRGQGRNGRGQGHNFFKLWSVNFPLFLSAKVFNILHSGPAPRGAFRGRAPQITACSPPPKRELCPPKARILPQRKLLALCHWSAVRGLRLLKYWLSP